MKIVWTNIPPAQMGPSTPNRSLAVQIYQFQRDDANISRALFDQSNQTLPLLFTRSPQ
ncbi:unnamed protein product [Acidithrix sp. C25]|nr:unnamed protein product [Acidithrix sp. C25]